MEKFKKIKERKKKQVSDELEELKSAYQEIQDIFTNEGEIRWHEKPRFKRLIETLDTKEDLDRHSLEVDSRLKDQKIEYTKLTNLQETITRATLEKPRTEITRDVPTLHQLASDMKAELRKLEDEIERKRIEERIRTDRTSKWNLFSAFISLRLAGDSYNGKLQQENLVERANELVGHINLNADGDLKKMFVDGDKGLECKLLERCDLPKVMSKHLVFPEDHDEHYWDVDEGLEGADETV